MGVTLPFYYVSQCSDDLYIVFKQVDEYDHIFIQSFTTHYQANQLRDVLTVLEPNNNTNSEEN